MPPDGLRRLVLSASLPECQNGLKAEANLIVARRGRGYDSVLNLWLRTGLAPATLRLLANADAFGSIGFDATASGLEL